MDRANGEQKRESGSVGGQTCGVREEVSFRNYRIIDGVIFTSSVRTRQSKKFVWKKKCLNLFCSSLKTLYLLALAYLV